MKNFALILMIVLLSCPAIAQVKTLYNGEFESGWYGAPLFKVGQMDGKTGYFVGGQGGWIINHRFVLGGKGYMLVNPIEIEDLHNIVVGFGCGGVLVEYILASDKLFHFSIESMFGIGGVYNDIKVSERHHDPIDYTGDACFVLEPGINLMLNVTKNFRIGAGATYRFVNGADYDPGAPYRHDNGEDFETISDSNLSGISAQFVLEFGVF